ncbi:MAG: replication-associated recombination protein A [Candidatus Caenarcaniphilales bacterium]|nr:replication-associated recombination protein A [Candidatus Caenarcaniphilales bacterium]
MQQLNLFQDDPTNKPLAEKYRPKSLDDLLGPIKKNQSFRNWFNTAFSNRKIPSALFWGPPGVGKTTIAELFANLSGREFIKLQAFNSGVKDIRESIYFLEQQVKPGILFVDELHSFSKTQQDSLLNAIEQGKIIFIGATTENPAISVNKALLSRILKFELKSHGFEDLRNLVTKVVGKEGFSIDHDAREFLIKAARGDARVLLNALEACLLSFPEEEVGANISLKLCEELVERKIFSGDPDAYYSCVSALQKSMRGSDPDASVYWLARLLNGGADLKAVARRVLVTASEDVGLADNNALLIAEAAYRAALELGMPEARIPLAQAVIYIANAPKSNASYKAMNMAMKDCNAFPEFEVPAHLKPINYACPAKSDNKKENPITKYKYPHDYPNSQVEQEYLPKELKDRKYLT